ncbi:MAG: glucokinase, partial [Gammaproteobacteria bacterium]|nr:glucokinase [Gammaproteobacteria bacterium]
LASTARNLALAYFASAGVLFGGGMLQRMWPLFDSQHFEQHFVDSGALKGFTENLPVSLVESDHGAVIGAAASLFELHPTHN